MGIVKKINPYTMEVVSLDTKIEPPLTPKQKVKKCCEPEVKDISPEDAKQLRLENLAILNDIINDLNVSATTRVQAIQAREKILKDLMANVGNGSSQRSLDDLKALLSDDEDIEEEDSDEIDSNDRQISFEELRRQMLDETEE